MKQIKVRIPTQDEFEAIALNMAGKIIETREDSSGASYVIETGGMTIELPMREWWRVREEAAE